MTAYKWFVLGALTAIYSLNQLDRYILATLAPYIIKELNISDTQLGFLYGTTFGLFYGLFGVPLGVIVDKWKRVNLLSIGLATWSLMTALSGLAQNFAELAVARVMVGVGEASATPVSVSLLCDYFRRDQRSTVLSVYTLGTYIGNGASLVVGGILVASWMHGGGPLGFLNLSGWRLAFVVTGVPGFVLALILPKLLIDPEPTRSSTDAPLRRFLGELSGMLPPWSLLSAWRSGGARALLQSAAWLVAIAVAVIVMTDITDAIGAAGHAPKVLGRIGGVAVTGNLIQWVSVGVILYAAVSWASRQGLRDPELARVTIGSPTLMLAALGVGLLGVTVNASLAFNFVYATRYLGFGPAAGVQLGVISTFAGSLGLIVGGLAGDAAKRRAPAGRVYLVIATYMVGVLCLLGQYTTPSPALFEALYGVAMFMLAVNLSNMAATVQDLVPVTARGTAAALSSLAVSLIALGLGPYCVGLISDACGDLRTGLLSMLVVAPAAIALLFVLARRMPGSEDSDRPVDRSPAALAKPTV